MRFDAPNGKAAHVSIEEVQRRMQALPQNG